MFSEEFSIAWPFFFASALAFGLIFSARNRPRSATWRYFVMCMMAGGLWSVFSGMHLLVDDIAVKLFWTNAKFLFVAALPVFWLLLARSFYDGESPVKVKTILYLFVLPAITVILIATNEIHHLVFRSAEPLVTDQFVSISRDYGPWFWIHTVYSYSLICAGVGIFFRSMIRSKGHLRMQALIMSVGSLFPLLFNALYLSNPAAFLYLDFTPISFAATGVVYFFGLFRFGMLDLMPIAREEVFRSMKEVVIVTDMNGIIVDANEASSALRSDTTWSEVGKPFVEEFSFLAEVWHAARDQERYSTELECEIGEAESWFRVDITQMIKAGRSPIGRIIVLRDITENKRSQRQLLAAKQKAEELSQLKSAFLSNMSHDVRTPLAGIIGLADVLVEECKGDHKQFAVMIREGGDRLLKLLNSLLSVSHLSTGRLDHNSELLDVVDISGRVLSTVEKELKEKHVELIFSYPDGVTEAFLDANHLTHALTHLLDHSVRYTEDGSVRFELFTENEDVVFKLTDTGRGFEPDFVRSINEPLNVHKLAEFGLDNGSGLGLRVANGLIEEMGGSLTIKSELAKGSTFIVRLPMGLSNASGKRGPKRKERIKPTLTREPNSGSIPAL